MQRNELQKMLMKKRIDLGITQVQMAAQLGVSASFLNNVERGNKKMPIKLLENLLAQFEFTGCEIEMLIKRYVDCMLNLPDCLTVDEKLKIKQGLSDVICSGFIRKQRNEKGWNLADAVNQMFGG